MTMDEFNQKPLAVREYFEQFKAPQFQEDTVTVVFSDGRPEECIALAEFGDWLYGAILDPEVLLYFVPSVIVEMMEDYIRSILEWRLRTGK